MESKDTDSNRKGLEVAGGVAAFAVCRRKHCQDEEESAEQLYSKPSELGDFGSELYSTGTVAQDAPQYTWNRGCRVK